MNNNTYYFKIRYNNKIYTNIKFKIYIYVFIFIINVLNILLFMLY